MSTTKPIDVLTEIVREAARQGASDIHLAVGQTPHFRISGELLPQTSLASTKHGDLESILNSISPSAVEVLTNRGSFDGATAFDVDETSQRFRFNAFQAGGKLAIAFRRLESGFRSLTELGLSERLYELCQMKDGLVLIAGPTGSGKSTTLATLIDQINRTRSAHIITIEDPIEYLHKTSQSLVNQRQIGLDTPDFHQALVDAVRQDPDVILVGELRELQTIRTAITAAETGHLVFGTIHASDTVGAVERIVGIFPGDEQPMIQQVLSSSLRAVVAQHLLPGKVKNKTDDSASRRRVLASEVMQVNSAIANLISSGNLNQIGTILETSSGDGMYTLDSCLARLLQEQQIDDSVAGTLARNPQMLFELSRIRRG